MVVKRSLILMVFIFLVVITGCGVPGAGAIVATQSVGIATSSPESATPSPTTANPPPLKPPVVNQRATTPTQTASPAPTATATPFEIGKELTIDYLRNLEITGSEITFEQELPDTLYYEQHIVSYISDGNKIYGLLLIPIMAVPEGGFKAIVFNHGYIPPSVYQTTERYTAYVDYLARSGFVVFKIDLRGHGRSQGQASGSYYSSGYTIDAISALKSLQTLDIVDPQGIGMWGHSMAGNLVLRAMLVEPDIKAGVIWAGAVYSYTDFETYGIDDNTFRPPVATPTPGTPGPQTRARIFDTYGRPNLEVDYWKAVSLTENIAYLSSPLQLHHAQDDPVVNIGYSIGLAAVLQENGKPYEFYSYEGGGHNLISPYFDQAMLRTVEFFRENL